MPMAIKVQEVNLEYIINYAKERGFNLDYLGDNVANNAEYFGFDTYLITDGSTETNNVTFTEMTEPGFRQLWKFTQHESPYRFVKIERV
jgi:hypothetical protein